MGLMREVKITTETIKLDQLLKYAGITQTGGQSKLLIRQGIVLVNGQTTTERGKKIKRGDIIEIKNIDKFVVI
jgi:ribosome-associated protein